MLSVSYGDNIEMSLCRKKAEFENKYSVLTFHCN